VTPAQASLHRRPAGPHLLSVSSPVPREVWQAAADSDPEALAWQTPAFMDALCATGPFQDASRLYVTRDGRALVLPMVRRRGLSGRLAVEASLPLGWGVGGIIAAGGVRPDEVAAVFADLADRSVLRRSVLPNPRLGAVWQAARPSGVVAFPRLAHVLELEGGFARVWAERFRSETRGGVRKAERAGLSVQCDTSGDLFPTFARLYQMSAARWAQQDRGSSWSARGVNPVPRFRGLAERLGRTCRIWMAWLDGRPVAAILVLQGAHASSYALGAMDKDLAGPTRANDLLQRLAIEDACRAGCRYYHMGESGASAAMAQFKERFGARPFAYAEYRMGRFPVTGLRRTLVPLLRRLAG
jgi:Acetyltransferase (GNAT) domain